jgi:hypothetical protein
MVTREEYAWSAGFFDGEGTVYSNKRYEKGKNRKSYRIMACIGQKDYETLETFKHITGVGTWSTEKSGFNRLSISKFEHVQHLACILWPWLGSVKKDQFIKAFKEFYDGNNLR